VIDSETQVVQNKHMAELKIRDRIFGQTNKRGKPMKLWKTLSWMLILVLAIGFVGCSEDDDDPVTPTTYDHFEALFALDPGTADNITAANLYAEMAGASPASGELFIIDFRSADHYAAGYIEGAVNWAITDLVDKLNLIPTDAKVVCYCYSGQTASQASATLNLLGYDAWNLKWGMCGWTNDLEINLGKWPNLVQNDIPLSTATSTLEGTFDYPVQELETDDVLEAAEYYLDMYLSGGTKNISSSDLYANLLDGDASNDPIMLNFWSASMYDAGHFEGAVQAKPIDLTILEGVDPSKQIVVYCHTGQTSSKLTVWLRAMGYDAYSMLYGMNSVVYSHDDFVTYHGPDQDYPLVTP
jgi:sulfur-carrier protein adenylyltransferase/sulfurtransferase